MKIIVELQYKWNCSDYCDWLESSWANWYSSKSCWSVLYRVGVPWGTGATVRFPKLATCMSRMYDICSGDNCSSDKSNVKRNPNPNPKPKPNINPYPTPNHKPNHYPHSNSFLSEISSLEQLSPEQMSDHRTLIMTIKKMALYSASQNKQNPETKGCCDQVPGCMTIIIYISWIMINLLSNDT